ncbi:MAG TPA: glutathione S-transferase family protein [Noviherbaspirillum sp.]|uniref:glutathione S-transferase family protein n=1 Tax=Noviherbaspirillum sp. TaxID=1926288 RepID=UPI002F92F9AD
MKPVLISHPLCPYVQRAVIALEEKGAAYERVDIDLAAKPKWFLALSPLGKTPLLRVGEETVFESAVICEYLEDTLDPPLHPADPLQRARNRSWMEFSSAVLNAIWRFYTARDEAGYGQAAAALRDMFLQVEAALGDGPYFNGEAFSLVDAAFAPAWRYFEVFDAAGGVDLMAGLPKLQAWRAALAARPSVRNAVGPDYPALLRAFVIRQDGMLGGLLRERTGDSPR